MSGFCFTGASLVKSVAKGEGGGVGRRKDWDFGLKGPGRIVSTLVSCKLMRREGERRRKKGKEEKEGEVGGRGGGSKKEESECAPYYIVAASIPLVTG